ncbi:MAG: transcription antitermination factor NusB [Clostridia bacterium]|nr:transcription antitermination factor NusB [Clostridia bacterium]
MSDHSKSREKWIKQKREARKQAFFLLFEQIFQKEAMEDIIQDAKDARDLEVDKFTKKLISGVEIHIEEIDKLIEANLKGWRKNRISKVSLTIMRMAVYEMLYEDDIPVSVSINEAVELAKEFATPADGSFVNGVLGSVSKQLENSGEK